MGIEGSLSSEEVVRVAINMEKQGLEFYSGMAGRSEQEATKAIFEKLASDEKRHFETFSSMLDNIGNLWGGTPDEEREIDAYLSSLVELQTFGDEETQILDRPDVSPQQALRFAIHAEKDAIVYYGGAADYAGSGDARDIFQKIAGEERGHLAALTEKLIEIGR